MAKQTKKQAKQGPRWSIGLFRSAKGKLSTCYVRADGTPMPYEEKRVKGSKILFHAIYNGMLYREAHQQLLKDAAAKGIKAEAPAAPKADAKPAKKTAAKKATPRKRAAKKTTAKAAK